MRGIWPKLEWWSRAESRARGRATGRRWAEEGRLVGRLFVEDGPQVAAGCASDLAGAGVVAGSEREQGLSLSCPACGRARVRGRPVVIGQPA